jgi:soluble lytic murein transglycosylase-like protein
VFAVAVARSNLQADSGFPRLRLPAAKMAESRRALTEREIAFIFRDKMDRLPAAHATSLARHFLATCHKHGIDPALMLSLIQVESAFRTNAVSPVGAIGLMQLMPSTAQLIARRQGIPYRGSRSLRDPFTNLSIGIAYFAVLRDKYKDLPPYFHIAAYNIGPAKLDQLLTRKSFRPTQTRVYFDRIRETLSDWKDYRGAQERARERAGRRVRRRAPRARPSK